MSLPTVIANDFYLEVARGNVTGYTAREIVGQNAALAGADKFIWGEGTVSSQDLTEALPLLVILVRQLQLLVLMLIMMKLQKLLLQIPQMVVQELLEQSYF